MATNKIAAPAKAIDPVARQADALLRLWGKGAAQIARRYLADAKRIRKADRVRFWEDVLAALEPKAPAAEPKESA